MGAFYGSTQVRTDDRDAVVVAVEQVASTQSVKCLVSPVLGGWVGIYPENQGQDHQFGAALAEKLDGFVLHMLVHDSGVMAYWLWRDRQLVDSYWSRPGYFGEEDRQHQEEMAGRPEEFRPLVGEKVSRLAEILRRDRRDLALEDERLESFAKLLKISNALSAYEYLKEGDASGRKGWRKFIEIPADAPDAEAEERREYRNQAAQNRKLAAAERRALEKDGLLLLRDERKDDVMSRGCAVHTGYVVAWRNFRFQDGSIEVYREPWKVATAFGLEPPAKLNTVASDASGRRMAVAGDGILRVWDASGDDWNLAADLSGPDFEGDVALSSDGQLLARRTRELIVVTRIDTQETLCGVAVDRRGSSNVAFHPSGDWVVVGGETLGLIYVPQDPHWRDLFVGGQAASFNIFGALLKEQVRNLDIAALKREQRAHIDAMMASHEQKLEQSKKGRMSGEKLEFIHQAGERMKEMRPMLEKQTEDWISGLEALKEGREPPAPPKANEPVRFAGFSRDGQWLWCGTSFGLRVYRWESVPRSSGSAMPQPTWQFVLPNPLPFEGGSSVTAIVEEADAEAIVFGGADGRLYQLDLQSGGTRELAKLPGMAAIQGLAMSSDGATLGVSASWLTQIPAGPKDVHLTWDVWSYPRLRRLLVHRE